MMVLMFSTAGVPPFVGFWAKLWIIQALLHSGHLGLAIFAVVISVVGAYYYLRVVWYMYFESAGDRPVPAPRGSVRLVLAVNTLAVAVLGFLPNALMSLCEKVIQ
jgi:NADH-quinone oxidoreductase subunit N